MLTNHAALTTYYHTLKTKYLCDLFSQDTSCTQRFSLKVDDLSADYSKNCINERIMLLLLVQLTAVITWRKPLSSGATINNTEKCVIFFIALRKQTTTSALVESHKVMSEIETILTSRLTFSEPMETTGIYGQYAFYQWLSQGTSLIPADFILSRQTPNILQEQHGLLIVHFLTQTEALMRGHSVEETITSDTTTPIAPELFTNNHPNNAFSLDGMTSHTLGLLIAVYENKFFVKGISGNLNFYDRRGVKLEKQLVKRIFPKLQSVSEITSYNASTNSLINYYHQQ